MATTLIYKGYTLKYDWDTKRWTVYLINELRATCASEGSARDFVLIDREKRKSLEAMADALGLEDRARDRFIKTCVPR